MVVRIVKAGEVLTGAQLDAGETDVYGTVFNANLSGGRLLIENGGVARVTKIDGGVEEVLAGGADFGAVVNQGRQIVRGTATNATLAGGNLRKGVQEVYGAANATIVNGGMEIVHGGGASYGAQILAGSERIDVGGSDYGALVTGGTQSVYGFALGATLSGAGRQLNYGFSSSTTLNAGGELNTWGTVANTVVAGGTLKVRNNGVAQATTINGGAEHIDVGGFDYGAVINQGKQVVRGLSIGATLNVSPSSTATTPVFGSQEVFGSAFNTTVNGGYEIVKNGGVSRGANIVKGREEIAKGGNDYGAVLTGGSQVVYGTATGALIGQGAAQTVYGTSDSSTLHGGQLEAKRQSVLSGTVTFDGSGYLTLHNGVHNDAILALNAGSGATVEFADMKFAGNSHYALLAGNLDVWEGSAHQTLHIAGAETLTTISLSASRSGATLLNLGNA